jgi:hypothetical protein
MEAFVAVRTGFARLLEPDRSESGGREEMKEYGGDV